MVWAAARRTEAGGGDSPGLVALWFGIIGPPTIWLARLAASYLLVPLVCRTGWLWLLNAVTGAALLGVAVAAAVALRSWRLTRDEHGSAQAAQRARFMAVVGMLVSALFFAVIVAEGLANLLVDPCLTGGAPL